MLFPPDHRQGCVQRVEVRDLNVLTVFVVAVNVVYQVVVAHLDPLGLLLVGSVLELTCLVLQVPTGLLADTYSRKLAVVAGTVLIGAGFMVEGLLPYSSDAREHRFADVTDEALPGRIRRLNESELRGLVCELAMEHALLQTWVG